MAISDKIRSMLNSPKAKQAMERGRQELAKPENQRKIKNLLAKVQKRR